MPIADAVSRAERELGLRLTVNAMGAPVLDVSRFPEPKWPRKLDPLRTVVIDTSVSDDEFEWPAPRFEILIANLDSIGLTVVQVGDPSSEKLQRAQHHFVRLTHEERAGCGRKTSSRDSRGKLCRSVVERHVRD
jgi:hypothetical protein